MTFSQIMLFTADLLTCHSMKCAGGINSNDGSVPLIVPVAFPVVSHHGAIMYSTRLSPEWNAAFCSVIVAIDYTYLY